MRESAETFGPTFAGMARPSWSSTLLLLVVATFGLLGCMDQEPITPLSPQEALAPLSSPDALGHESVKQSERRVRELPDGRIIEQLHGQLAYRHLRQLVSRRPEAFANLSVLADRGYRPSEEVLVQRVMRPQPAPAHGDGYFNRGNGHFIFAQSYEEGSPEGEIIFWSWDDGDDSTWEGVIWFEDYTTGVAGTNEAQVDISSTEAHELVFLVNTWESGGGGGSDPGETIMMMWSAPSCPTIVSGVSLAGLNVGPTWGVGGYTLASARGWSWRNWGGCTVAWGVGGCAGAATGCRLMGPGWAKCTGAFCAGAFVASAIGCALDQVF